MDLTREEELFVEGRAKFARSWPIVGTAMLVAVLVLAGWLLFTRPMLINPWAVLSGLESGTIPDSTLAIMAALLPVVMLTCLFVLVVALILFSVAFSNEKKHIAIIRRMIGDPSDAERQKTGR